MGGKTVVTIGVFDGVHLGHQKILKETAGIARRNNATAVAVTFSPHPASALSPGNATPSLISLKHRLTLLHESGIDKCVVINFTERFAQTPPGSFIRNILMKKLNAGWVVVGEDFCFGRRRHADADFLKQKSAASGFIVKKIKTLKYKGISIRSSLIRRLIQKGKLALAGKLLGRPVTILGTVVRGSRLGREIGFPTANINPHHEVVPPSGVYAVRVKIGSDEYGGVLNIGVRPTFYGINRQDKEPYIEVYIFKFSKCLYGKDVEVVFLQKLRPEKKFDSKEALIKQIKSDVKKAGLICR